MDLSIGTLVEQTTRFTMLLHLPRMQDHGSSRTKNGPPLAGRGADAVRDAIGSTITTLPEQCDDPRPGTRALSLRNTRSSASRLASRCISVARTRQIVVVEHAFMPRQQSADGRWSAAG